MRSALVAVFANIVLNLVLVWFLGTGGLALSTAVCSYLQVVILVFVLRRRFGRGILQGMVSAAAKTVAATMGMCAAIAVGLYLSKGWADMFKLVLVVPSAAAAYLLAAKLLRIEMLSLLTGRRTKTED